MKGHLIFGHTHMEVLAEKESKKRTVFPAVGRSKKEYCWIFILYGLGRGKEPPSRCFLKALLKQMSFIGEIT